MQPEREDKSDKVGKQNTHYERLCNILLQTATCMNSIVPHMNMECTNSLNPELLGTKQIPTQHWNIISVME